MTNKNQEVIAPRHEPDLRPGVIVKRILKRLRDSLEDLHLDGPPEYQRGFAEGYRAAIRGVESEDGNIACEVTAWRSRQMSVAAKAKAESE